VLQVGVTVQTYYRWRKEHSEMSRNQLKRRHPSRRAERRIASGKSRRRRVSGQQRRGGRGAVPHKFQRACAVVAEMRNRRMAELV